MELLKLYIDDPLFLLLVAAAMAVMVILKENRAERCAFFYVPLITLILLFNPVTGMMLGKYGAQDENLAVRLVRFYWVIQTSLIIACAATLVIKKLSEKREQYGPALFALFAGVIILIGIPVYGEAGFVRASNVYKLSDETVKIVDMINEDASENGTQRPVCALPLDMAAQARQYDAGLILLYGRYPDRLNDRDTWYYDRVSKGADPMDAEGCAYLKEAGCDYAVVPAEGRDAIADADNGFIKISDYGKYTIYRIQDQIKE